MGGRGLWRRLVSDSDAEMGDGGLWPWEVVLFDRRSSSLQNLTLSCKENEKKALLKFKENLTNQSDSGKLSSWNEGDCCKWSGVSCSTKTGHVIKLDLRNTFSSTFEVNPSLLQLNYLSYLDLSMNNFGGTQIPEFFGSFTILRYLNLSTSSFGGKIPRNLGNLSGLQYLDLRNYDNEHVENGLEWLSGLSSLKYLNLDGFDLYKASSYWLQTINTYLPSLLELHLSNCQLMSIPSSLPFVNFTSLSALDLSSNGFNSTIPNWLFNLTNLKTLDLSLNNLHGILPNEFSELTLLENLDLSFNGHEGSLSFNSTNWQFIGGLNGNLPSSLGLLKNLKYLLLQQNSFTGPIPSTIGNLSSLEEIGLSDNEMNGTIPESIGQLKSLVVMNLYGNSWEGVITEAHLSNLSSLREISIGNFFSKLSLVFNISSNWLPPFKLKDINIGGCKMGPKFPAFLMRNQSDLEFVIINFAGISDAIPDWFLEWSSNLTALDLKGNELSGPIPKNIGTVLPLLTYLDISRNNLNGTIPLSIGKMPSQICNLSLLHILDISRNNLSGEIPACFGDLDGFKIDHHDFRPYEGRLKLVAKGIVIEYDSTLYLVNSIDLSGNYFSGEIPSEITSLLRLGTLNLSMNHLTGQIPPNIERLQWIETLDLSKNRLSGPIPPGMASLTSLSHLNLSHNSLSGSIPTGNQFLTLNDPSIYEGNTLLCGFPLSAKCNRGKVASYPGENVGETDDEDRYEKLLLSVFVGLGFFIGFWGVCGSLIIKKQWRDAYFCFCERVMGWIIGIFSTNGRLRRNFLN
ncbi:hypothetical protein BUALT_Bualt07G0134700 [Buddleja alternifolia]|uniref:Leucine-rich repeat-containing N-terminal plant-type domain-containing protein n=1 Tax=Buddleja alternifolia TaxID=168488 RepID=A0AAV6XAH3_9LAMI|nr:hypothetical protein BUALT_Bualt07G0134700 [Buddleja alternifolia]